MRWVPSVLAAVSLLGVVCTANPLSGSSQVPLNYESHDEITGSSFMVTNSEGIEYEQFSLPGLPNHKLRLAQPMLCDPSVRQYSGYLDISDTRHLFFWFFEARTDPESAPLLMWLNGGPGCSSTTGLLFENGPCTIVSPNKTVPNPHSWNNVANMLFLDQPIGTGFSYASDGSKVDTLADLAVDVFAFLQLFAVRLPQYGQKPLHIAAESWGGHYGPNIASYVNLMNKKRIYAPFPGQRHIDLASLVIANGLTEPKTQFGSIPEYMCGGAPYPPFKHDSKECVAMRLAAPTCENMIETCYRFPFRATCNPATVYCWMNLLGPVSTSGLNHYDLRIPCEDKESGICYTEMSWVQTWMNDPAVKRQLGVDRAPVDFLHCNMTTNAGFYAQGQAMHDSAALLPRIIKDGIRLLVFAGDTDGVCNHMGVERWMLKLEHKYHKEFSHAPLLPFISELTGTPGGKVRSAGGAGAGNVTYVQIFDGGHMAPHDQPEATLDMITRWIKDVPFDVVG